MRQLHCPQPTPTPPSAKGGLPLTYHEVTDLAHVCALPFSVSALGTFGLHIGESLVTTRNEASSILGQTGYDCFQLNGSRWTAAAQRVSIRVDANDESRIFYTPGDAAAGLVSSLFVADEAGAIGHWIEVNERDALDLLVGVDTETSSSWDACPQSKTRAKVIALDPIREMLSQWHASDLGHHLDTMIEDRGVSRRRTLKVLDQDQACQTSKSYLEKLIGYLCHRKLHFCFSVPSCGILQTACGAGIDLRMTGKSLECEMSSDSFSLDLDQVASAWITRHLTWQDGRGACTGAFAERYCSALELYNEEGQMIALLHSSPWAPEAEWNRLIEVLPRF